MPYIMVNIPFCLDLKSYQWGRHEQHLMRLDLAGHGHDSQQLRVSKESIIYRK